jgi:hypothetical protein
VTFVLTTVYSCVLFISITTRHHDRRYESNLSHDRACRFMSGLEELFENDIQNGAPRLCIFGLPNGATKRVIRRKLASHLPYHVPVLTKT